MAGGGEPEVPLSITDYFRIGVAGLFGTPGEVANEIQKPAGGSSIGNVAQATDLVAQRGLLEVGQTRTAQQVAGFIGEAAEAAGGVARAAGDKTREILLAVVVIAIVVLAIRR